MSPPRRSGRSRRPSYGDATRVARLLHGLRARPHGWSFAAVLDELGISQRTLLRYLATCRAELVDREGRPLIETFRRGPQRMLRLAAEAPVAESSAYQVLFFYFALSVFSSSSTARSSKKASPISGNASSARCPAPSRRGSPSFSASSTRCRRR